MTFFNKYGEVYVYRKKYQMMQRGLGIKYNKCTKSGREFPTTKLTTLLIMLFTSLSSNSPPPLTVDSISFAMGHDFNTILFRLDTHFMKNNRV